MALSKKQKAGIIYCINNACFFHRTKYLACMKFLLFLLSFVVFGCCCSSKYAKKKYNSKADSLLHILTAFDDSLFTTVPDSFKKWIRIWDTVFVNDARYRQKDDAYYHENVTEQNKLDSINIGIV